MNKVKIYTKTGDKGKTSLFGGKRVDKNSPRIEAYGTVDELNTSLGVAASFVKVREIKSIIQKIQNELFNIGSELSNPQKIVRDTKSYIVLGKEKTLELESIIDQMDKKLPPLNQFIIPGGTNSASLIHLSRAVTRRAERRLVTLSKKESINKNILSYLNRLSDLLFVMSRYLNHEAKVKEKHWEK